MSISHLQLSIELRLGVKVQLLALFILFFYIFF